MVIISFITILYFKYYDNMLAAPYVCKKGNYPYCTPFNENTWRLLGTTDDYKEE